MSLLSKCAVRAVDYDIRLASCSRKYRKRSSRCARPWTCSLDNLMDVFAWAQCQLPGPLGGCGGRLPSTVAHVAYRAA